MQQFVARIDATLVCIPAAKHGAEIAAQIAVLRLESHAEQTEFVMWAVKRLRTCMLPPQFTLLQILEFHVAAGMAAVFARIPSSFAAAFAVYDAPTV